MARGDDLDTREYVAKKDGAAMFTSGHERSDRFTEVEGVHLIKRQLAILQGAQEFSISATARAEGFHRQGVVAAGPQMAQEQ